MIFDMHVHTSLSFDCEIPAETVISEAFSHGISVIAITDHHEPGFPFDPPVELDFKGLDRIFESPISDGTTVLKGVEAGLIAMPGQPERVAADISGKGLDFVIASTHLVGEADPYRPEYFDGKTRGEAFGGYITEILRNTREFSSHAAFSVIGHIDYPTKGCPWPDNMLGYADAPDELDALFRFVIAKGAGFEINTSIFRRLGRDTLDITWLRRYRELGGEIVTVGSDSHGPKYLGYGFAAAVECLRNAGFEYVCTFSKMEPVFHRI